MLKCGIIKSPHRPQVAIHIASQFNGKLIWRPPTLRNQIRLTKMVDLPRQKKKKLDLSKLRTEPTKVNRRNTSDKECYGKLPK